jgi:hypothetical protein
VLTTLYCFEEENTLNLQASQTNEENFHEDISEYVAQLQLHMALHARNLVPTLTNATDSRHQLLQETQANIEKLVSRQVFS